MYIAMKHRFFQILGFLLVMVVIGSSCGSTKEAITVSDEEKLAFAKQEGDTIKIASNDIEYEIIIIEPGFNFWLQSIAKPEGYYTQSYLENRNKIYVTEWNQRVLQPFRYDPSLY